jgi:hypothetical protein
MFSPLIGDSCIIFINNLVDNNLGKEIAKRKQKQYI